MGKKIGPKTAAKLTSFDHRDYSESFEQVVKRWALVAAKQLRDSYAMQKVFRRGGNAANEIWRRMRKTPAYHYTASGRRVKNPGAGSMQSWGWFDENALRKRNDDGTHWFSTGHSYDVANVTTENLKLHKEADMAFLIQGQVTFHTTLQMLYVEAGVGASGRRKGQSRKSKPLVRPYDIDVDKQKKWTSRARYIKDWAPGKGHTVRPNTRQQVNLFRRRMAWLAMEKESFELSAWIVTNLESALSGVIKGGYMGNIYFEPDGEVSNFLSLRERTSRNLALASYMKYNQIATWAEARDLIRAGGLFDIRRFREYTKKK